MATGLLPLIAGKIRSMVDEPIPTVNVGDVQPQPMQTQVPQSAPMPPSMMYPQSPSSEETGVGLFDSGRQQIQWRPESYDYSRLKTGGAPSGLQGFLSDPENLANLALGFNTMRLSPDQGLAQVLGQRLKTYEENRVGNRTAASVANLLRARGMEAEATAVEQNPSLAAIYAKYLTSDKGGPTEAYRTREQVAKALGHAPGSPEYNAIMAGGKPGEAVDKQQEFAAKVRGEFVAIPQIKAFSDQSQAYGRIVASAEDPSAAGDLALIFNYMKLLDPGSTVREGEFATAQNAGGVDQRIVGLYNRILDGTRLSGPQREDFLARSNKLYSNAESQYNATRKFYAGVVERGGLKPDEVLPSFTYAGRRATVQKKPANVSQEDWNSMTPAERQQFINAGNKPR